MEILFTSKNYVMGSLSVLVLLTWVGVNVEAKIDCYRCDSQNGSNANCGDPFSPMFSQLEVNCHQTRVNGASAFPARYCTKIIGRSSIDGTEMVVRSCSLEPLENMCGMFELEKVRYTGCVMSCNTDACNGADRVSRTLCSCAVLFLILITSVFGA